MGEIADGLLDGTFDSITGEYLGEGDGYPHTMTVRPKYRGTFRQSQRIIDRFPNMKISVLQGNGLNVYTGNATGTITIWWQKGKWVNSRNNKWKYFHDHDKAELEMIAIIEGLTNPNPQISESVISNGGGAGVQQCIDHLLAKAESIHKAGGGNQLSTLLKITAQELTQYI